MKHWRLTMGSVLAVFWIYTASVQADRVIPAYPPYPASANTEQRVGAASLAQAITDGQLLFDLRLRDEFVDQDGKPEHANALTLRTLLGWKTLAFHDLSATLQFINVSHIGSEDFNDTSNGYTRFPTVADPEDTDVNLLYLDYTGLPVTRFRLGRQAVILDNQRFVGNVGFRQIMQVFNGITVENKSLLPDTELYAGYMSRIRNIFAQEKEVDIEIAHAAYEWKPDNKLVAYGYFHNQARTVSNTGLNDSSNRTVGMRADGKYPVTENVRLLYTAEYAHQDDYAGGNSLIDAGYLHLGMGAAVKKFWGRLDYELLESNNGAYAFQTPLGTNHAFQGWADLFLTTPRTGIQDWYLSVWGKFWETSLYAEYHGFDSDVQDIDFGTELDVGITYPIPWVKGLSAKIEYAHYDKNDNVVDNTTVDTQKVWLTLNYIFGGK